nr:hypothetical protein [Tanacetum cinerariifolium]
MSMNCLAYELQWTNLSRNINPVAAKQVSLDKSLVPSEKRLKNEKCNARIEFSKTQREETYQVTLDALKLSPCYPTFLITAEVPKDLIDLRNHAQILWGMYNKNNVDYVALLCEDFMYQADNREISSTRKEHMPYPRLTKVIISHFISKDMNIYIRNRINLHIIRDEKLLDTLKFVSKKQDYQQYRALIPDDMINQDVKYSKAYKTYYDFATRKSTPKKASKFKKVASPSRKLSLVLKEEPAEKPKRAKKHAKKSTTVPTSCVVIRDTPSESVPKKKTPAKVDRGKGMDLLLMWHYLKLLSLRKLSRKASWKLISFMQVAQGDSGGDDDDDDNDDNSDEVTKDDDEDDVESDTDDDKEASDRKECEEMIDVGRDDSTQQTKNEQVKDDENVTLITIHDTQNTEGPMQSSFVSSDFANQFMNLDNIPPTDTEVISLMNVKVRHEEPSTHTTPLLNIPFTSSQPKSTYEAATPLTEFELKKILLDKIQKIKSYRDAQEHKDLYDALVKSYKLHKDLFKSYVKKYSLKRDREDKDKDEDLPARSDQGLKKKKTSKDAEPSRDLDKAVTYRLDWTNPKGREYPFDLSKPLPLINDQGRQAVPANYFINNDLEYLNGKSSSRKYMTSTTKTKAAKYDTVKVTHVKVTKKYDYGYLEEIVVQREDQKLYKFIEGDFPRLNMRGIEDMLILLA